MIERASRNSLPRVAGGEGNALGRHGPPYSPEAAETVETVARKER